MNLDAISNQNDDIVLSQQRSARLGKKEREDVLGGGSAPGWSVVEKLELGSKQLPQLGKIGSKNRVDKYQMRQAHQAIVLYEKIL